ncbi:MAG: hypothetical protein ACI81A_002741, partial [Paraglaciecola sp.]
NEHIYSVGIKFSGGCIQLFTPGESSILPISKRYWQTNILQD